MNFEIAIMLWLSACFQGYSISLCSNNVSMPQKDVIVMAQNMRPNNPVQNDL